MLIIQNKLKEWVFEGTCKIHKVYLTESEREELVKECLQCIGSDVTIARKSLREA